MFKKIVGVVVLMIMMFSFTACNQTNLSNELERYKASAISELEVYAESKGQDNYFDADWETIMLLLSNAELEINEAKNASEIESIFENTKKKIDEVTNINNGMERISKQFDLTDPTDHWSGNIEDLASGGGCELPAWDYVVQVTFKKTSQYPILSVEDFKFNNAENIHYTASPEPIDLWFWQYDYPEDFRQVAEITLKERSHEKVLEAIEYLQSLDFIKRAEPMFPDVCAHPVPCWEW